MYAFGPFRFDPAARLLWRGRDIVPLTPKAGELLGLLIENAGNVLSKDDLIRRAWPDTFVEEANLSHHVYRIREALGEHPEGGQYIETLARRGYRFVVPVTREAANRPPVETVADPVAAGPPPGAAGLGHSAVHDRRRVWRLAAGASLIVAVIAGAYAWRPRTPPAPTPIPSRSLAVLPFADLEGTASEQALSFGMAAAVITRLARVDGIVVRPVSAIVKYGQPGRDVLGAAREQQVDAVLDAHLQRADDRVRVTVQLVRASDGKPIWASTFDERMQDVFTIQDAIAEKVVSALQVPLTREGWGRLSMHETRNMLAYQAYMNGAVNLFTFAPGGFERSVKYFSEAVRLEPDYARAHAGLAFAYAELAGISPQPREQVRLAREHAEIARRLDDTLPELHFAMINIRQYHDWDWPGVEAECQRLIAVAPGLAQSYQMHGWALSLLGKFDEGLAELRRAQIMDPNSSTLAGAIVANLTWSGRLAEAREEAVRLIKADPAVAFGEFNLAQIEVLEGHVTEAVRRLEAAPVPPLIKIGLLGHAYGLVGRRADAERAIAGLGAMVTSDASPAFQIAQIYAGLGESAQALDWLERAHRERSLWMAWLRVDPSLNALRSEPRFQTLMAQMKF